MTKLIFGQNGLLLGRSFWPKDSLVTLILFELWLLWYLAQSQIHQITLYYILLLYWSHPFSGNLICISLFIEERPKKTLKNDIKFINSRQVPKLYTPITLNIDLILWHTQFNVCAVKCLQWFKSWFIHFTFQAFTLPHTLNCMCVCLFKFQIWILKQL